MANKKSTYCINCGKKHSDKNDLCGKCSETIDLKDHEFRDFIYDKVKDKIKGEAEDSALNILKALITKYFYGITLSMTIVFTGITVTYNIINKNSSNYVIVNTPLEAREMQKAIAVCDDEYELKDDKCVKEIKTKAAEKKSCKDGYTLRNNTCVSNQTYEKTVTQVCEIPNEYKQPTYKNQTAIVENGVCMVDMCGRIIRAEDLEPGGEFYDYRDQYTVGDCSMGSFEEVPFTDKITCEAGLTVVNGECKKTAKPETSLVCDGELKGKECITYENKETQTSCPIRFTYDEDINFCIKR